MSEKNSKQVLAFTAETSEAAVRSITAFYAIATTAKIYHWQSAGSNFEGDHLLFDRIFDDIYKFDYIDIAAESLAMQKVSYNPDILNDVQKLIAEQEGKKFSKEDLMNDDVQDLMFQELGNMLENWNIESMKIKSMIPQLAQMYDQMYETCGILRGLIDARLRRSKIISRLEKAFNLK